MLLAGAAALAAASASVASAAVLTTVIVLVVLMALTSGFGMLFAGAAALAVAAAPLIAATVGRLMRPIGTLVGSGRVLIIKTYQETPAFRRGRNGILSAEGSSCPFSF